ncbi:DUF3786 domain-containing protein [Clostridium sp. MT-14]|jgi:hypothetical protein|uniref:DUF3786 domain-containing protein n=1 Tax=Clostridium aromativorans TaxID=2836848 RepID=A0ABS8N544_9CLOT|nr:MULTISPECIES: DUF3786 domain-containing protein [Clostridium]KAA8672251.1 DUF3786 domain-containing protein [Clostridium sp. HV4-5-A1G]MCC9294781.1 DUF3786 domain-containing protein [Clostridium aromativorans]CAB1262232.1 conserved hypothetical protein [Clostridiaceae bacterium BL-3]
MGDKINTDKNRKDKIPYDHYKTVFKNFNPEIMAKNTGCTFNKAAEEITVKLMGQDLIVRYPSGDIYSKNGSKFEAYPPKTLILRYLIHGKGVEPSRKYITYREIEGGNVYYNNFYGRCILRLSRTFGKNVERFKEIFEKLGAEKVEMGDAAYKFQFLNNIYVIFAIWKDDEEFPASSQILFNSNVLFYFTAEDLAVVGDVAIGTMMKLDI